MGQRTNAAVIGAGAAGLVCARELARQNIEVTIFEKSSQVGNETTLPTVTEPSIIWLFTIAPSSSLTVKSNASKS